MDLNKIVSKVGSSIVTVTVFLFALFLMINFPTGYFFVCLILPIGFIMMTAGIQNEGILSFIHFTKGEMRYEKR